MSTKKFMTLALEKGQDGIRKGQTPFGACIVRRRKVISVAHNVVWKNTDITAHAEVTAIRDACRKLKTIDLSGCILYSTCEPCPMCFSAAHWAGISEIVFGTSIRDAKALGFSELTISTQKMKLWGKSRVKIRGGFMRREALQLFRNFAAQKKKRLY